MSSYSSSDVSLLNPTMQVRYLTDEDTPSPTQSAPVSPAPAVIPVPLPPAHPTPCSPPTTVPAHLPSSCNQASSSTDNPRVSLKRPRSPRDPQHEDDNTCTICCEPWTSSGDHQIVCLPCGHLFGFHCIQKWLQSGRRAGCPMCKHPARVRDLRYLFGVPPRLQVLDNSECERLKKSLENEKSRHEVTKGRLRAMERLVEGLRRDVTRAKRGVKHFGGAPAAERGAVKCVANWATNGASTTGVFDGGGRLLFGENAYQSMGSMRQRVSRLDIGRSCVVGRSQVCIPGRITRMAICEGEGGLRGCVAVGAGRMVTILRSELMVVGNVDVEGGMVCSVMWWGGDKVVMGTERGDIVLVDLRMLNRGSVWRKSVGGNGRNGSWRIHSLGKVGTGFLAGTTRGVYWVGEGEGEVANMMSTESMNWICGVEVDAEVVAVASRTRGDAELKGRVVLHDGVTDRGGEVKLGRTKRVLEGHRQTLPFSVPGVVAGRGGEGDELFVCMGDGRGQRSVRIWGESGGEGVCTEWRGSLSCTVGMRVPRAANMGTVDIGTQALFGCIGDSVVKVYGVGKYP